MPSLTIKLGPEEILIRKRYEAASILNDVLIAIWFIIGSVLFFFESTTYAATWCFLIGSIEFLVRPMIRLIRQIHISRISAVPTDSGQDY